MRQQSIQAFGLVVALSVGLSACSDTKQERHCDSGVIGEVEPKECRPQPEADAYYSGMTWPSHGKIVSVDDAPVSQHWTDYEGRPSLSCCYTMTYEPD